MISSQTFVQSTPSAAWTITHNFGAAPVCDVLVQDNGVTSKILPLSVKHISNTQLLVEFSVPTAGTARLVGKYSAAAAGVGSIDMGQNL